MIPTPPPGRPTYRSAWFDEVAALKPAARRSGPATCFTATPPSKVPPRPVGPADVCDDDPPTPSAPPRNQPGPISFWPPARQAALSVVDENWFVCWPVTFVQTQLSSPSRVPSPTKTGQLMVIDAMPPTIKAAPS